MSNRYTKPTEQLCPACKENPARIVTCSRCGAKNTVPCRNCQHYPIKCKECGKEIKNFKIKPENEFEGPKIQNNPDSVNPRDHELPFD